jgi:short-subunit dehydrogenase
MAHAPALEDSVLVITGASSGIGRATAQAAAKAGASVVLAARGQQALEAVAAECVVLGGEALAVPTDVADQDSVQRLAERALERFGRIDVWVNNAAVMAYGRFEDVPADIHRQVIETNLFGQVHGARAVLPVFRQQNRGLLVNVASLYAKMTSPYVSSYITSKFGVLGFSEVLRQELHDAPDIHVCTILPASVDTPIFGHSANYTGRKARPVPPVADPDRAVKAILACVEDPQNERTVGQVGHVLSWGHVLLPKLYNRLVPHVMDRVAFVDEEVEHTSGNVCTPSGREQPVTGGWRPARPRWVVGGIAAAAVAAGALARRYTSK